MQHNTIPDPAPIPNVNPGMQDTARSDLHISANECTGSDLGAIPNFRSFLHYHIRSDSKVIS
jgi:hypothetical protein